MLRRKLILLHFILVSFLKGAQGVHADLATLHHATIKSSKAAAPLAKPHWPKGWGRNDENNVIDSKISTLIKNKKFVQNIQKTLPHFVRVLQNSVYSDLMNIVLPASICLVASGTALYMYKYKKLPVAVTISCVIAAFSPLLYKYEIFPKIFFNKKELREIYALRRLKSALKRAENPGIFSAPFFKIADISLAIIPLSEILIELSKEETRK